MDPRDGSILAMASVPTFDPNDFGDFPPSTTQTVTIKGTLAASYNGATLANTASVTSPTRDLNAANNRDTATAAVAPFVITPRRTAAAAPVLRHASVGASGQALADITSRGSIRVAVPQDSPPFGTVGPDMELQGLDIDMAKLIATKLGVKIDLVPVTLPNRIPYLQTNKADIVIAGLYGRVRSGQRNSAGLPESGARILRDLIAKNKNIVGVSINPCTNATPHIFVILSGATFSPNPYMIHLLSNPIFGISSMIQPIAFKKPGTITATAVNVVHNSRQGTSVRLRIHASGTLKNNTAATVPSPTITVFGITR